MGFLVALIWAVEVHEEHSIHPQGVRGQGRAGQGLRASVEAEAQTRILVQLHLLPQSYTCSIEIAMTPGGEEEGERCIAWVLIGS